MIIAQLKFIGGLLVCLALFHAFFPRRFDWKNEFKQVSLLNRQMMYIHTLFIALGILLMGMLCLTAAEDLVQSSLGKKICAGFAIFWTVRLCVQFFGYSSLLWKGKRFETSVHIVFTFLWTYLSSVFWWIWWH